MFYAKLHQVSQTTTNIDYILSFNMLIYLKMNFFFGYNKEIAYICTNKVTQRTTSLFITH